MRQGIFHLENIFFFDKSHYPADFAAGHLHAPLAVHCQEKKDVFNATPNFEKVVWFGLRQRAFVALHLFWRRKTFEDQQCANVWKAQEVQRHCGCYVPASLGLGNKVWRT